jgi:hypothetical protein
MRTSSWAGAALAIVLVYGSYTYYQHNHTPGYLVLAQSGNHEVSTGGASDSGAYNAANRWAGFDANAGAYNHPGPYPCGGCGPVGAGGNGGHYSSDSAGGTAVGGNDPCGCTSGEPF